MQATYSVVRQLSGGVGERTVIWSAGTTHALPLDRYATEAEAQAEADRLLALAWAPEA
jgi:hypothetical protein